MYNYAKNGVTVNNGIMASIEIFNTIAREFATKSVEANTAKKDLEAKVEKAIADKNVEAIEEAKTALETHLEAWKNESATYNLKLYGGKEGDKKTEGIVDAIITNDMYKAYVEYMKGGAEDGKEGYKSQVRQFMCRIFNEYDVTQDIKASVFNHFYADIMTMSKKNSNKNIAEGCAYISVVSKRNYKYMICGALADIIANNHTLKVARPKKNNK